MKIDLVDFVSVEEREQLLEKLLTAKDSTVIVDASHLKHSATNDEYNQVLLSAKFFADRLRRFGWDTPTIQFILPENSFAFDLNRIDELRRVAGLNIKLIQ
jgi:hypothetical protein